MIICLKRQSSLLSDTRTTDLSSRDEVCFFGQGSSPLYDKFVSEVVTPGVGYLDLPFLGDGKLGLPKTFDLIETSSVRPITMADAPRVLQRYEELLRQELETPSELDRFVAVPES